MRKLRPKVLPGQDTKAGVSHTYLPRSRRRGPGAVSSGAAGHSRFPPAVEHGPDPRGKLVPGKGLIT
jgi:hypothetical protein